jgi:asparagine N-glycosylation enzyme membrane subunit Stt3
MSTKPRPEQFKTRAEYRWARKLWLKRHGGHLWATLAIAIFFGAWSGSTMILVLFLVFALVGTAYARSRP